MPYEKIIAIECELSAYRKGSMTVHIDLQQGYLSWRESRQWCNNFIRSLTDEQIRDLRDLLRDLDLSRHAHTLQSETTPAPEPIEMNKKATLQLTLFWADQQLMLNGEDFDLTAWKSLSKEIEKLSRVPFKL